MTKSARGRPFLSPRTEGEKRDDCSYRVEKEAASFRKVFFENFLAERQDVPDLETSVVQIFTSRINVLI